MRFIFQILMSLIFSIFNNPVAMTVQSELSYFETATDFNDYQFEEQNFQKSFINQIEYQKDSPIDNLPPQVYLLLFPKLYQKTLVLELPQIDLNLLKSGFYQSRLSFELQIIWETPTKIFNGQKNLTLNLSRLRQEKQILDGPSWCWPVSYQGQEVFFWHQITFEWQEKKLITLHHLASDHALDNDLLFKFSYFRKCGLKKAKIEMNHLRIIYDVPKILTNLNQLQINFGYEANQVGLADLEGALISILKKHSTLQQMNFENYFLWPQFSAIQKKILQTPPLNDLTHESFWNLNLQKNPELKILQFYQAKFKLVFRASPIVNLNLWESEPIIYKHFEEPQEIFLERHEPWSGWLLENCLFENHNEILLIKPKVKTTAVIGQKRLKMKKMVTKLSVLKKPTFLILELPEKADWTPLNQLLFQNWQTQNEILQPENFQDFQFHWDTPAPQLGLHQLTIQSNSNNHFFNGESKMEITITKTKKPDFPTNPDKGNSSKLKTPSLWWLALPLTIIFVGGGWTWWLKWKKRKKTEIEN